MPTLTVAPARLDISLYKGAGLDVTGPFQEVDDDCVPVPGTLVDLTGQTARLTIRDPKNNSAVLETLTTENGGIVLGGTAGTIRLIYLSAACLAAVWSNANYDLFLFDTNGMGTPILAGSFVITTVVK